MVFADENVFFEVPLSRSQTMTYIDGDIVIVEFLSVVNPSQWILDHVHERLRLFAGLAVPFAAQSDPFVDHVGEMLGRNNELLAENTLMHCLMDEIFVVHAESALHDHGELAA